MILPVITVPTVALRVVMVIAWVLSVCSAPEKWNLPAYITVIIQAANLGPLIYSIVSYRLNKHSLNTQNVSNKLETGVIFAIIFIGAVSTLFLSFFHQHTSYIGEF